MPARNSVKQYVDNSYYHIYNRGVEKRVIFLDDQDYAVFLNYLKDYLSPKNDLELRKKISDPQTPSREKGKLIKSLRMNNFHGQITLLSYCLMPNHFHFFIKQKEASSIDRFMQSLGTRYTMYFNRKYKRVGSLFQAVYKAVLIDKEAQFVYLSKYIHKQALALQGETLQSWEQPSSYKEYLNQRETSWVNAKEILSYFSLTNPSLSYQSFIESNPDNGAIESIVLEETGSGLASQGETLQSWRGNHT